MITLRESSYNQTNLSVCAIQFIAIFMHILTALVPQESWWWYRQGNTGLEGIAYHCSVDHPEQTSEGVCCAKRIIIDHQSSQGTPKRSQES